MIGFIFTPWRRFVAFRDKASTRRFMDETAKELEDQYRKAIVSPPKTGRIYNRKRGKHQASINRSQREYPANDTGKLAASIKSDVSDTRLTFGTTMFYGRFLREGTRKMVRRKMSDNILKMVMPRRIGRLKNWVVFRHEQD